MQNTSSIKPSIHFSTCSFSSPVAIKNLSLSPFAFRRFCTKSSRVGSCLPGIKMYKLPCGCFVWRYASGARELSALPF